MGKRGRVAYEDGGSGIIPLRVVAQRMNLSERTVSSIWNSAVRKLNRIPGAYEILLACVYGNKVEEMLAGQSIIRCGSIECNQEFCNLYSDGGSNEVI